MTIKKVLSAGKRPVKIWTNDIEPEAEEQLDRLSNLPFIHKHVACMPDVHAGKGSTIGSVIATKGAIVPAAVGVDIGCGMMAYQTTITANDLPDNLSGIRSMIEEAVPHGRTDQGGKNDRGSWGDKLPEHHQQRWKALEHQHQLIIEKHPKAKSFNTYQHMGTLGTGNHFIELCLDENDAVWVMLHSGSRGVGNRLGTYFIEKAKEEMRRWHIDEFIEDMDLSYLVENTELFDDYIYSISWAQDFAWENRKAMMESVLAVMHRDFVFSVTDMAVNCHHNYATKENHFGANIWVTRKGAVRARSGDLGIIPGSMGAKSFIVRGKGNKDSFHSCSHGAGRKMSRTKARSMFTPEDLATQTQGVECKKDVSVIDEIPSAYKDIDEVMKNQVDLVDIVHTLRQVVCVKG